MTTEAPTGEEWKLLSGAGFDYDPAPFADTLAEARERILRIRRGPARPRLLGKNGEPLRGITVQVRQTHADFLWGDQLWGLDALFRHGHRQSAKVRHFTRRFTECLNSANCLSYWTEAPRNDGPKHMEFQGEDHLDEMEEQVAWALSRGLVPKGHPVFWSLPKAYPSWLQKYPVETQWKFIEVRVRNLIARFRGRVKLWDVVNEPMWEAAPHNLPRRHWPHLEDMTEITKYVSRVLRWVREEDPAALCIINEYGLEKDGEGPIYTAADGTRVTAALQRRRFLELAEALAAAGTPPDALGMQAHTGAWMTPDEQQAVLDELALAGLPLHYTEFWTKTSGLEEKLGSAVAEKLRAEYAANVLTIAFAHPSVQAFYFWGDVVESFGFRQDHNTSGLPSSSHEPTPLYHRVRQLIREEWMTSLQATTDADGCLPFTGFFGRYELTCVSPAGVPVARTCGLHEGLANNPELVFPFS
jgi:GH35 family endo-1,4-beta-xylanase